MQLVVSKTILISQGSPCSITVHRCSVGFPSKAAAICLPKTCGVPRLQENWDHQNTHTVDSTEAESKEVAKNMVIRKGKESKTDKYMERKGGLSLPKDAIPVQEWRDGTRRGGCSKPQVEHE